MNRKLFLAAVALGVGATGIAPASAQTIPALSTGITAPTAGANVGTNAILKGTMQYSNSAGTSDAFSVGTQTNISANASASSTADYNVKSIADFGMGFQATSGGAVTPSTINQVIGSSGTSQSTISEIQQAASAAATSAAEKEVSTQTKKEVDTSAASGYRYSYWYNNQWTQLQTQTEEAFSAKKTEIRNSAYQEAYNSAYSSLTQSSALSGTISGSFEKDLSATNPSNNVTVRGIGANNTITAASDAGFSSQIDKNLVVTNQAAIDTANANSATPPAAIYGSTDSAGTASGSASGNVSTTASANANSTQFISSFVQAY